MIYSGHSLFGAVLGQRFKNGEQVFGCVPNFTKDTPPRRNVLQTAQMRHGARGLHGLHGSLLLRI